MADDPQKESEAPKPEWPKVIKLKQPFDYGDERITSFTFRRGRLGDIKGMKLSQTMPVSDILMVASKLCGQPVAMLEMVDADDAGEVTEIALDFYAKCLVAGQKP